uniref:hypothetical protein n=1 Tax=Actinomadura sp. CA-154981 TaxID=3240037 RepID=UPI003F497215
MRRPADDAAEPLPAGEARSGPHEPPDDPRGSGEPAAGSLNPGAVPGAVAGADLGDDGFEPL